MSIRSIYKPSVSTSYGCWNPDCITIERASKRCSKCREAIYCGVKCQKADWQTHKITCHHPLDKMLKIPIAEFSKRDLVVLGYSKIQILVINRLFNKSWAGGVLSKKTLSCFEYTLLEVSAKGSREQIFNSGDSSFSLKTIMEERLIRWGYKVVSSPRAGDFVLYFNKEDLKHMGLYLEDGQVKSKPGNGADFFIIHPVKALCYLYGSKIVYYRKDPKIEGKFKEENLIKFTYI